MKNKVHEIWSALQSEQHIGLVKRLYSADSKINVYCIYQYPEDFFGIALSYPKSISFNLAPFASISEPIVEIFKDSSFSDSLMLCAKIRSNDKINEFSYLCENVIQTIISENKVAEAVKTFGNTLLRWKNLFERVHGTGLSKEEQQGLYGELRFLKKCIDSASVSYYNIVQNYVGTNRALRDFQGKDWAVEVKTTSTNNPQSLIINGERQLDDSMIETLYLFHCSVEVSRKTGESLPDMINNIRALLKSDVSALSLLNAKLFEVGYLDEHESLYLDRHYLIRNERFYHVKDDFPRILEGELRDGVGNVKYSISISSFESYRILEQVVISKCLNND